MTTTIGPRESSDAGGSMGPGDGAVSRAGDVMCRAGSATNLGGGMTNQASGAWINVRIEASQGFTMMRKTEKVDPHRWNKDW
jgi:hypothetical protein